MTYEQTYKLIGVLTSLFFLGVALFLGVATLIQLFQLRIETPVETTLAGASSIFSVVLARGAMKALIHTLTAPVPPPD